MEKSIPISKKLEESLIEIVEDVYDVKVESLPVEHPEMLIHGDMASSAPLALAAQLKQSPLEIAKKLAYELQKKSWDFKFNGEKHSIFKNIEAAPPGFINFVFSPQWLNSVLFDVTLREENYGATNILAKQKVMVEFTDPNPFKIFHVGHIMTNTIGESLSRIFEFLGAEVKRGNYQGDVGIHVANSIWGLVKKMGKDNLTLVDLERMDLVKRVEYLGEAYSLGAKSYLEDDSAKQEMQVLNNFIYLVAQDILVENEDWQRVVDYKNLVQGQKPPFSLEQITSLYKAGRKWSLEYFETMYEKLNTSFDNYYFESRAGEIGLQIVNENIKNGVFKKDQGAVIFEGEKYGLHTRVFVNSKGLPVYEAKDLGLSIMKSRDYDFDKSLIVTGNEVNEYFQVVLKAMELVKPDLAGKTTHIGHGMMVFAEGRMSSRTGEVVAADELLRVVGKEVKEKIKQGENTAVTGEKLGEAVEKVSLASVKYSILKSGIGQDVKYDEEKATNLTGNTGPYLLYTYARTRSVLEKAGILGENERGILDYKVDFEFLPEEMEVLRHIYKFSEQVELAAERLAPNIIASFIHDLAQKYNTFYAAVPIIKAPSNQQKVFRLHLTQATGQVIKNGLHLLGIQVVDKM